MAEEQTETVAGMAGTISESVTNRILRSFAASIEATPELAEIAARFRGEIIEKGGRSESALRRALFGDLGL